MLCGQPQKQPNNLLYAVHSEQLLIYRSLFVVEVKPNLIQGYNRPDVWGWLRENKKYQQFDEVSEKFTHIGPVSQQKYDILSYEVLLCSFKHKHSQPRTGFAFLQSSVKELQGFKKWLPHYTVYKTCLLISGNLLSKRTPF